MALIDEEGRRRIAEAIADVERRTDAELVTVLASRSDDYGYIPVLWAAIIALLLPLAFVPTAPALPTAVGIQLGSFCLLALLFSVPAIGIRLIPADIRRHRAANMARRQFLERGLHHTLGDTGVLIFVSEAEHYVEILVDRGIAARVDDERWASIVGQFVEDVRAGLVLAGFLQAIGACGELLAVAVPKTPDNRNELDDRLFLIGYD